MSTFKMMEYKCGLCGNTFESLTFMSTNAFGSPDLDLRPPMMKRGTMPMWIKKCPNCGYVHSQIEKNGKKHKTFITTKEYLSCEDTKLLSVMARDFYKYAMILLREKNKEEAYNAFLHAAWSCDDMRDRNGAVLCRNKAISLYTDKLFKNNKNFTLRHIDLLRRAGRFSEAIAFIEKTSFDEEIMQQIAEFQAKLSSIGDDECFRVTDCDSIFMTLDDEPFELMESGQKTVEVRCNDEKRRELREGDRIIFHKATNPRDKIFAEITELHSFDTFKELYSSYPLSSLGYGGRTVEDVQAVIDNIYTKEEQEKYGALAITISVHPRSLFG